MTIIVSPVLLGANTFENRNLDKTVKCSKYNSLDFQETEFH